MTSTSTQLVVTNSMSIYEPIQQVSMWADSFKVEGDLNSSASPMFLASSSTENKPEFFNSGGPSGSDQETNTAVNKVLRRLAQNREAARKSRLRKKAYVQQLECSRLKLMQLELELEKARKQGFYMGGSLDTNYIGASGTINPGITMFEIEYGHWVEEQNRQIGELTNALQNQASDVQLPLLVESGLNHFSNLFRMKAEVAKADVFYLVSGVWQSSVERMFLWIGGYRPSELLNILLSNVQPLTDQQSARFKNLRLSSQQAEDALSQGLDKLQQSMVHNVLADSLGKGNYGFQMDAAIEKIEALEGFVNQADHLREQTLQQTIRTLDTHQAARGMLALGEYFRRLRTLSSLWSFRQCDSA